MVLSIETTPQTNRTDKLAVVPRRNTRRLSLSRLWAESSRLDDRTTECPYWLHFSSSNTTCSSRHANRMLKNSIVLEVCQLARSIMRSLTNHILNRAILQEVSSCWHMLYSICRCFGSHHLLNSSFQTSFSSSFSREQEPAT